MRGQFIAIGVSAAVAAAQYLLRPVFDHSVYLLGAMALVACALFGGPWSILTASALLTAIAIGAESQLSYPLPEVALRALIFLVTGVALAAWMRRLGQQRDAAARAATAQADREALLQASLAVVADALVVVDDLGQIQSFSDAAERLFGWTASEVLGRNFSSLMPPGEAVALGGGEAEVEVSGSSRQVMGLNQHGDSFPMELRIGEARIGGRRFLTIVVRDLSSIQEAERRSEELRAQLTQLWSLNSMGEMASVLAHELNQPLSAVTNYLRAARNLIARMELDDDDLIDAVARAGDQAVRAGEIIRTMRDLATRGGALQKPESLSAIIGEVDFIVSIMAREAAVRIVYDLHKGEDTVMADRIQIQQLVVNLARNAIEAVTKYPNRQVNISTRPDADSGMVTTVEDSGPGIDPSVAERLFQPLASTKPEGMGLGLSISSAIVENHKGRIWAEPSRLGGAAFCFVLARAGNNGHIASGSNSVRRRR
ncbi:ATP-binding protein [uncultured Phenylobacterium sp.]|uniref:PAS domain-containing sensor histidine kinase n=1 Tax=uncultured Phenylobacterium sp. TaxID=349273 RepID=UPI0025EAC0FE|nr:ATP-binding protein [uncultured Phenylobacterium sp.]